MKITDKNLRTNTIPVPDELLLTEGCCFLLYYNNKYIVVMGKTLIRQIESIEYDIKYFSNSEKNQKSLYYRFCKYVSENKGGVFSIKMVLESENPYQLLKECQKQLDIGAQEPNSCLNTYFEPFISKTVQKPRISGKTPSWVNRGYYLNFKMWQKKRHLDK